MCGSLREASQNWRDSDELDEGHRSVGLDQTSLSLSYCAKMASCSDDP